MNPGRRRGGRRMMNEINVVPYIDVMLVLLVIFMVTAPLVTPGQIELPSVAKSSQAPAQPLEVIIKADGALRLRDREKGNERDIDRADLVRYVRERQAQKADLAVVISGDRNVRYESVLSVMDDLAKNDIKRVGLSVRPAGK